MSSTIMMEELSWVEYQEKIKLGAPVILAAGATEQHGPHLPLGTDVMQVLSIAREVSGKTGAIVAPPLSYGYKSQPKGGGGQSFVGTTSLDGQTLIFLVRDVLRELLRHGVRRILVIDGHYGNVMFLAEGVDLALREAGPLHNARILLVRWFEQISEATLHTIFGDEFPGLALEHAAVIETSVMGVVRPDLVHWDRLVDDRAERVVSYETFPPPADVISHSGVLAPASRASVQFGELILSQVSTTIAQIVSREFNL